MFVSKFSKITSTRTSAFGAILSHCKYSPLSKALAGALVLGLGQTARAVEVAPYFHYWGGSLVTAKNSAGMTSATLAFGVTRGSCALDVGFQQKLPDARNYVAAGGKLWISFGGADGVYAEIACKDDNQLFALMEKVMSDSGSRRLDFDVEGQQLLNTEGTARRSRVLARLQAKYPDMSVSFTLPSWLRGFDANSINLLKTTAAAGVRIDRVNAMAMSFGVNNIKTLVVPATLGQATIMAFRAVAGQVAALNPNKTQTQINAMIGITPMIGTNDDGSTFTLADAQTLANFAKLNGVGHLSYWSFQRDRAQSRNGTTPLNDYSGVVQADYQFHTIFKSAGGYVEPTPSPTPAPPPTTCQATSWVQGKQYAVGSKVTYSNGGMYIAKFANPGYNPTISIYFWSRYYC